MIEKLVKEFETKCDYIDVRVNETINEAIFLENGDTNNVFTNNKSYGVRVLINGGWGMAYSYDLNSPRKTFEKAFKIAKLLSGKKRGIKAPEYINDNKKVVCKVDPFAVDPVDKIKLLKEFENKLKNDKLVKNVSSLIASSRVNSVVYAPGINVNQEFTNNVFKLFITAREGELIQSTSKNYSKLGGYDKILSLSVDEISNELLSRIKRLLHAKSPKPERATVVCDPQMTGLFFHEAVGHACEADTIINQASVFQGMDGKMVASEEVNLLDDPTIKERGFYWYDDEGVKAKPTKLITKGLLTGKLHSLKTANELGEEPTGNGRVMNAEFPPIPRMSNTVILPGSWGVDDLIKEAYNGYYVKGFAGGVVDPITGQFSFGATECFRITNGVISEPLRDVTLAGNIIETLKGIKVGNDQTKTMIGGTCGKANQHVRVGDYCPSILVKDVIIGGSA